MAGKRYSETHKIVYYEGDTNKALTLPTLLNLVIQCFNGQSEELNRGEAVIASYGVAFVVTQYEIAIKRLPKVGETVTLTTEATNYNKFFCYRDFWVYDEAGNECVAIRSTAVLMDLAERKLVRVIPEIVAPFESERLTKVLRFPKPEPVNVEKAVDTEYRVRYLDIDSNRHVNNAKYLDWMLDSLGYEFLTTHELVHLSIKYDKEVEYGHIINSQFEIEAQENGQIITRHQIVIDDGIYCEANFIWR